MARRGGVRSSLERNGVRDHAAEKVMAIYFRGVYQIPLTFHVRYEGLDDIVLYAHDTENDVYHRVVLNKQEQLAIYDSFGTSFGRAMERLRSLLDEFYSEPAFLCSVTQKRCVCHGGPCVHTV